MSVAVVVPTFGRPDALGPLVANIHATAPGGRVLFVCEPGDRLAIKRATQTGADVLVKECGTYPKAANAGFARVDEPVVAIVGDDVIFHPGWLEAALAAFAPGVGVVGTNDLHNEDVLAGRYSTQPLVERTYIETRGGAPDAVGRVYFEGYHHNWEDVELAEVAQSRNAYAHAYGAVIEHIHPDHGLREPDGTDERGQLRYREEDEALFLERRARWSS